MTDNTIIFGPFSLDTFRAELRNKGEIVNISQRGIMLLSALIQSNGHAVSKAELMEQAWPGMIVEEGNLTVQIAALRKALGTTDDGNDWIVTVPRVGYRLLQQKSQAPIEHSVLPSLAVLPFQNLSGDAEQDYFADGVVEDIITALSRFKSFAVIARSSSFVYNGRAMDVRQVASELGVRYVLQGSIRRAGERLRITAQLVDGSNGVQLWAQNFDGERGEVFDFQERITECVASIAEPQIQKAELEHARTERKGSVAVYDIFLQARAKLDAETKQGNAEAFAMLNEALALEPDNALVIAYAGYAFEHAVTMGWRDAGPDFRQECISLARRGLHLAGGDATAMAFCAMTLIYGAKEYDWGMATAVAALEANPNNMLVVMKAGAAHLNCGDLDIATTCFHRALRLSPRDPDAFFPHCGIAHIQCIRGNHAEAFDFSSRALALNPSFGPTLWVITASSAHLGRMEEAHRFRDELLKVAPDVTIAKIKAGHPSKGASRMGPILEGLRLAGLPEG